MELHGHVIQGSIDKETRCNHYHSECDRVAIKFYCCKKYFPCFKCHDEYGCGRADVWPKEYFNEKAILCGTCGRELSINNYLNGKHQCPACRAGFNPGCFLHSHLYFKIK